MTRQLNTWSGTMDWDTPENYERRREQLERSIAQVIREFSGGVPFTDGQIQQLRDLVAERSELLHWDVYNDSFSRNNSWLYGDYLALTSSEARFAILAFSAGPGLKETEFAIAFEKYLDML